MNPATERRRTGTGLILTGGGARAAYQVGVLKAVLRILRGAGHRRRNPFPIIVGTSAGAINASALACGADDIDSALERLHAVWYNFHADQVYRADALGVIRTGAKWLSLFSLGWAMARWRRARPRSLLDNEPLRDLLQSMVPMDRLPMLMQRGHLQALAVSVSSYTSGHHVTYFEAAKQVEPWSRSQRIAMPTDLTIDHLMATSAIPFVFPAVSLPVMGGREYFGDGSMRQVAPISPAIHLGAERVLVIGAGRMSEPSFRSTASAEYPNLAQVAGHAMSTIFLDALSVDVERVQRVNQTIQLLTPEARARTSLRPIEVLVIAPSQRLDDIAAKHLHALPTPVRSLLRATGVSGKGQHARGAALASYLLFESAYTRELMALGEADAEAQTEAVLNFFGRFPQRSSQ